MTKVQISTFVVLACLAGTPPAGAQAPAGSHDHAASGGGVIQMPRDLEMRLAVNALPKELRAGATVMVLEPVGFVKAAQGTNHFTCMVSRRGGNFYPVCFDEEGTKSRAATVRRRDPGSPTCYRRPLRLTIATGSR